MFAGDAPVVAEAGIGRVEPLFAHQLAVLVEHVEAGIGGRRALGEHGVGPPFPGDRIDLGVCSQRGGFERAEIALAHGFQRFRVEAIGTRILAQGKQFAVMGKGIGVAGVVTVGQVRDAFVISELVAIDTIEPPPCRHFGAQPLGLHIAAAVGHVPVLEPEHREHAVAVEDDVILERGIKPVTPGAVIGPVPQSLGNLALHLALEHVCLEPHGHALLQPEAVKGVKKFRHCYLPFDRVN